MGDHDDDDDDRTCMTTSDGGQKCKWGRLVPACTGIYLYERDSS